MPRLRDADVALGNVDLEPRGDDGEVLLDRLGHPRFLVEGLRLVERHLVRGFHQRLVGLARQLAQQFVGARERALGRDHAGGRAVVRRTRLLHVGDRDQADFEALLRLLELAVDRLECRRRRGQRVVGREHVEVALRYAHHQVLLRGAVVGLRERDLGTGTLERLPLVPAEEGLGELYLVVPEVGVRLLAVVDDRDHGRRVRIVVEVHRLVEGRVAFGLACRELARRVDLGKEQAACLRLRLECGEPAGVGLEDQRVTLDGGLVDLEEVLRARRRAEEGERNAAGEEQGLRVHAITVWRPGRPVVCWCYTELYHYRRCRVALSCLLGTCRNPCARISACPQ